MMLSLLLFQPQAQAKISLSELIGTWLYVGVIYEGQRLPPPNPKIHLRWEFREVGLNRLTSWISGEHGFCDREAIFWHHEDTGLLSQQILWVNPENRFDCSQDEDMLLGRESWSALDIVDGELHVTAEMGGQNLILVWTPDREAPPVSSREERAPAP